VGDPVTEACTPLPNDPDPGCNERLGGKQFPGERNLPSLLDIKTGSTDFSGDPPGEIDGEAVFLIWHWLPPFDMIEKR
jgi:hypothetical protein